MTTFTPKLSAYTMTQLNELLEDDEKLSNIVQEMDEMQGVQQSKDTTLASNRNLAELNLALQPQLEQRKEKLSAHYSSLQESFETYQFRKSTLDHSSGNTSLDTLLALLQAEGAKIEEETENMADSFLDGDVTLDTFIDAYQSNRKLAHLRRVKIEKLQEMVLTGQRLPQAPAASSALSSGALPMALQHEASASTRSPMAQPRRKPPQPPQQQPLPSPGPAPPTTAAPPAQPSVFYTAASPYPPIPPRSGQQFPNIPAGYPSHYLSQYPAQYPAQYAPALPQRPQGRLAHQPGFIMQ
ncbi:VPS37B subunit of ESCRT-I a [Gadus macrocephalus]|uniref:VPS37B subunit of ESCRT-I a n=1 Tax=Gadus macrocephalus TaxID=80720 RepID=UPI0028CB4F43|nr:VPS37B subunit of ESCRT-I a [Gadus macrocephalus]